MGEFAIAFGVMEEGAPPEILSSPDLEGSQDASDALTGANWLILLA